MADNPEKVVSSALVDAVRKVKIAAAERNDVVVDMKEADRARLEILAQHLRPVFDEVPVEDDRFDFVISSGLQPRLWIDATAHIVMGRDRRLYRFVRDTRMGRITIAENNEPEPIGEAVTTYIAERLHDRELAFAADDEIRSLRTADLKDKPVDPTPSSSSKIDVSDKLESGKKSQPKQIVKAERTSQTGTSATVLWLMGLFIVGGGLLLMYREQLMSMLQ
ncbi:MAG: hypothetical protein AAFY99_09325 [Pseudomonadota bacterium]